MAKIAALFTYSAEGAAPAPIDAAGPNEKGALEGDRHGAKPGRKILMVDQGILDELGLEPGALREQITVEGLPELDSLPPGTRLEVGDSTLEITKACAPCLTIGAHNQVEDPEAFRDLLEGRRGMFVEFVGHAQKISVGDQVAVLDR